jgi:putative two-component system response regulator
MNRPVIIADDERIARSMLANVARRTHLTPVETADGAEALAAIGQHDARFLITDWDMPVMDGLELCKAARQRYGEQRLYIIMVTSNTSPEQIVRGLEAGANDFIAKPFNPAEVTLRLAAAQRMLDLQSAEFTIFALAKLAETRHPETGRHLERVRAYCRVLAEQLRDDDAFQGEIDTAFVELIYHTSPLHDIGKVAIPDAVLLKEGALTDDEFAVMQSHTVRGAETLDAAAREFPGAGFLEMARDITRHHHEKYDGSGYPDALAAHDIPLAARIMALADVYDALTSKRCYKDAFTHEHARGIITGDRGKHFDPTVADAFLAREDDFIAIQRELAPDTAADDRSAAA